MRGSDFARLVCLAALWGGSFVFMRVAVSALGPLWLVESRVALAFLALYALARIRGDVPGFRARWRDYAVVGIVNTALPFALFSWASQHVPASVAAILNATSPFFGAMVAALWLGDRVTPGKLVGMVLGFAGVVLLVGWQPRLASGDALLAVCACLIGALCYGIASVYAKTRLGRLSSFAIALYSQMVASIVLAPVLPFAALPAAITPVVAANVLGLAVASTALAYLLYFRLIADLGPARALTVTFLIPMFGVLWGWLFLGRGRRNRYARRVRAHRQWNVDGGASACCGQRPTRAARRLTPSDQLGGGAQYLLAQLAVARQRRRVDAEVLHLRRLQAALLDDLELLVAGILHLLRLARVDDGDDGHVTIAHDEPDVLVGDLAKGAQAFHALGSDLHLQDIGKAHAREDLVARKRRLEQKIDDVFRLRQEPRAQQVESGKLGAGQQARGLALGPLRAA